MNASPRIRFANAARPPLEKRTFGLGVIGLGTVGTGTLKVLMEHQGEIRRRLGCGLELKNSSLFRRYKLFGRGRLAGR